jgi:coproporphyrinogen III oxidase
MKTTKEDITNYFKTLQDSITKKLSEFDGKCMFKEDIWVRNEGGGGRTRTTTQGNIIEKGGIGFSAVHGIIHPKLSESFNLKKDAHFYATGVSLVIHPHNPFVPIIHMNVRYFEIDSNEWWFGGGIDLTPHYINLEDAKWFHSQLKSICDKHSTDYYIRFKKWADDYFFLTHRNETRGIGGIFFDRLNGNESEKESLFSFVKDVGDNFVNIYGYFMKKNANIPYTEQHKFWQNYRRSRYVEFNLLHDAGTKFGLLTNGRTESILMSMPPQAQWVYNYIPPKDSDEEKTIQFLKKDIDWLSIV